MLNFNTDIVSHSYPKAQAILPLSCVSDSFNIAPHENSGATGMSEEEKVGKRIAHARSEAGMTQQALADAIKVSRPAIAQWEKGRTSPSAENLRNVAKATGMPLIYFFTGESGQSLAAAPAITDTVPVISWVQAGEWSDVSVAAGDFEMCPRPPNCGPSTFALRVQGESMVDKYEPGVLIFVDPDVEPLSGDDVVVICEQHGNAEATFKRYLIEPGSGPVLKVLNRNWHQQYMQLTPDCRVVGVVMAQMSMRRH